MEATLYAMTIFLLISWLIILVQYKYKRELKNFIKELMDASVKVRQKDFTVRLKNSGFTDMNIFVKNFNRMIEMLETYFDEIRGKNIQLDAIIKSVSNGVLVLDIDFRIFLINDLAKKSLKCSLDEKLEGRIFQDVIDDGSIKNFIISNVNYSSFINREITTEDNLIYRIKAEPVTIETKKELMCLYVINIEDITESVNLQNMRRDFAANVSHELKTPLTSISGFVETLKINNDCIDPETRMRFLDIIENESDRLKILINDILLLSKIEGNEEISYQMVDIGEVNSLVTGLLKKKSVNEGVVLISENRISSSRIYTHKQYFKEILINLVTNGIKYNKRGGFVKIIYDEDDSNYFIIVEDNGIGIREEEQNRIFERFYRVSKSRNKDIEGTGLGLAIVKHIVISLYGDISLESEPGVGSRFTVRLPKQLDKRK